jgi:hypothetical protein
LFARRGPPPSESREELVWSCCRTNWGSPLGTTFAVVTERKNALRPAVGSVSSVILSRVLPMEALELSSTGVWPSTVTDSWRLPTSSVKSRVTKSWVPTRIRRLSMLLKPCIVTFSV